MPRLRSQHQPPAFALGLFAIGLTVGFGALPCPRAIAQTTAEEQALALYDRAEERFRTDEFERAAILLREAIELHDAAPMHFNLARALRETGDLAGAVAEYTLFLEMDPDSPRRTVVEGRISRLDAQLAAADAERQGETAGEQGDQDDYSTEEPGDSDDEAVDAGGTSLAPWLIAAGAVVPLGLGVTFGVLFNNEVDAARAADDHQQAAEHSSNADTYSIVANVSFVVGGLMAVVGLTWGLIDVLSVSNGDTDVALRVGPASLELAGTF